MRSNAGKDHNIVVWKPPSACNCVTKPAPAQVVVMFKAATEIKGNLQEVSARETIFNGTILVNVDNNDLMVDANASTGSTTPQSKRLKIEELPVYKVLRRLVLRGNADLRNKHTLHLTTLAAVYTAFKYPPGKRICRAGTPNRPVTIT